MILHLFLYEAKSGLARRMRGGVRDDAMITREYSSRWKDSTRDLMLTNSKRYDAILDGKYASVFGYDFIKKHILTVSSYITKIKPASVLELGSGNGINIICLAVLHPDIKITGVELMKSGVNASEYLLLNPPVEIISYITGYDHETILSRLQGADTRVEFIEGDITRLASFSGASFDFLFSVFVLEQLPSRYPDAFLEAYRVAKNYALFIEAFREVQFNIFERIYLWCRDYFRQPVSVLSMAGFTVDEFRALEIRKMTHGGGIALVRKN